MKIHNARSWRIPRSVAYLIVRIALTKNARPLKRAIQQRIQNPLAVEMLKQEFGEGSRVKIDYRDGEFSFDRSQ